MNFGPMHLKRINMVVSTDTILDKFELATSKLYESIILNREENDELVKLRDSILPKLISGELKVKDCEPYI